ncbi:DUF3189 family protein [Paludifilum halophilum]|uniref:DUF3189 domain-containing protein n=1 Tax=Paludifilum halophilum TaxID=1642702 RepID=A0A235BBQ6_9BACL|nr:DUF3189 family protein [Paludifilum halophilum]OYD09730.1 hypothetical protein CHM34_01665 [Paludifilum halophilum]
MHIIYQCYGSAHSSIIAAAIHLNRLPSNRAPTMEEILSLPDFDQARDDAMGILFYKGDDERGNSVYTIGLGRNWREGQRVIRSLWQLLGRNEEECRLVHALDRITLLTKVGGALSRRYGIPSLGRPLAAWGIRRSYPRLLTLVEQVKNDSSGKSGRQAGDDGFVL